MRTTSTSVTPPPSQATAPDPNEKDEPIPSAAILEAAEQALARRGVLFMVVALFFFSGNVMLLKYLGAIAHVDAWVAMAFRAGIGAVLTFSMFPSLFRQSLKPLFTGPLMVTRGVLGIVGTFAFYYSVPKLGAGMSTLLSSTYIIFGALMAAVFLKEILSLRKGLWMAVAFGGLVLLTGAAGGTSHQFGWADIIALVGALAAAATVVAIRHLTKQYSVSSIFLCQCVYMLIVALPLGIYHFEWPGWAPLGALMLGAVFASLGQLSMNEGYRCLPVSTGASIQMALPVMASVGGYVIFGERFAAVQIVGAAFILLGCLKIVRNGKKKPAAPKGFRRAMPW